MLANLTTVGQVLLTYNPSIEQLLVMFPGIIAAQQSFGLPQNNPTGLPAGDFALTISDPNPCTVGFLPPSQWRNPEDETTLDTPDGLYCKLPQDSPMNVRGARNYPCIGHPGKRAPTVELCNDPKGFQPLAMRQHITGPYPFDPNLISQGVPLDDRVDFNERIYGPLQGTPLPPGAVPAGTPPGAPLPPPPGAAPAPGPVPVPPASAPAVLPPAQGPLLPDQAVPAAPGPPPGPPPAESGAVPAAPSAFAGNGSAPVQPTLATAHYDPQTGQYLSPDGALQQQANLAGGAGPKSWKDLMPT